MPDTLRLPYTPVKNNRNETSLRPLLPIVLEHHGQSHHLTGLLDTGADVNVLPYSMGVILGAIWDEQTIEIQLSGNLAQQPAKGIIITAIVGEFSPVRLAFAWTQNNDVPLILGQVNFFAEFNVCFFRSQNLFEIHPKSSGKK